MDDTHARRFLLLLLAGFLLLTALNINGSSVGLWSGILDESKTGSALLFSQPREMRSDEWLVWTPSLLAQANHEPAFPVENPALGAGRSPMLMNLPTRHYSTFFRPQLWGYFLFDIEHGYAWNWNAKIFGLLAAMFLLIRKLSDGSFWPALLGTAWIFCSSYMQWAFSCPPMLPEMLASWAFALWSVMKLCDAPPWKPAAALTAGLIVAAVNFALSMYPPYQIPVAYLGVAILAGWFWKRRAALPAGARWFPEPRWLLLAAAGVALIVVPFFVQMLPTLHLVAHTSYPGARRATGGSLGAINLFFGLTEPFISARAYPEHCGSVSAASNFFPIWPAAAGWMATLLGKEKNVRLRLLWPLLVCLLAFALFAICPLPPIVGRLTLLSFSTEERLILPIGIGGILLSVLALREMEPAPRRPLVRRVVLLAHGAARLRVPGKPRVFRPLAAGLRDRFFLVPLRSLPVADETFVFRRPAPRPLCAGHPGQSRQLRSRPAHGNQRASHHRKNPPLGPRRALGGLRRSDSIRVAHGGGRGRDQRREDASRPGFLSGYRSGEPLFGDLQPLLSGPFPSRSQTRDCGLQPV